MVSEADILVIVIDVSHPDWDNQLETVKNILKEMQIDKETIFVLNKIDLFEGDFQSFFDNFEHSPAIVTNAKTGMGIDSFKNVLESKVNVLFNRQQYYFNFDFEEFDERSQWIKM